MAKNCSSAEKRRRQGEERRLRNKAAKSAVKTSVRKFLALAHKKDGEGAGAALRNMAKLIDTAARKGVIKKNAASRKKSRMQKLFNSIKTAQ
ncbi:MAG: 30S ribosomal protein S20 [Spirochaetaceae bacterium]|nr:30S ribosomal protein S20 [Spirochaetaceae bacterium]